MTGKAAPSPLIARQISQAETVVQKDKTQNNGQMNIGAEQLNIAPECPTHTTIENDIYAKPRS